jgi:hypothetical protein
MCNAEPLADMTIVRHRVVEQDPYNLPDPATHLEPVDRFEAGSDLCYIKKSAYFCR